MRKRERENYLLFLQFVGLSRVHCEDGLLCQKTDTNYVIFSFDIIPYDWLSLWLGGEDAIDAIAPTLVSQWVSGSVSE